MDRWWWLALDMECCISSTHRADWYRKYIFFSFNSHDWHRITFSIYILGFWFEDEDTLVGPNILTVEMNNNHHLINLWVWPSVRSIWNPESIFFSPTARIIAIEYDGPPTRRMPYHIRERPDRFDIIAVIADCVNILRQPTEISIYIHESKFTPVCLWHGSTYCPAERTGIMEIEFCYIILLGMCLL